MICPRHLYIHWPFCASRCIYCDFVALAAHDEFWQKYHEALCKEIVSFANSTDPNSRQIDTIFLGGGTPSLYPLDLMDDLFSTIKNNFDLSHVNEITIETNPADSTAERFDAWKTFGINRLSTGVQVLDDNVLASLGRRQRTEDVYKHMNLAQLYFKNVSIDLILGLPGVSEKAWDATLQAAISWPLHHISVYFLTIYEKTQLYFKLQKRELQAFDEDLLVSNFEQTTRLLEQNNFVHYEISNFAKPGFESSHNKAYWDCEGYRGFGLSASSYDSENKVRSTNTPNLMDYLKNIEKGYEAAVASSERLTKEQVQMELVMLALRQNKGLDLHDVVYYLIGDKKESFFETVKLLQAESLVKMDDNKLYLTLKGMVLENEVILKLL